MKKILNNKYVLISCILVIFASLLAFSFADTTYAVNYTVGEHGTVNDKAGEFTEEYVDTQEGYPIAITPEEGYMIDKIIVDGVENEEYTTAAQSTLNYMIEDLDITQDTDIEVTFKEIDNPDLVAMAEEGFAIKATSEGPGTVLTVFDENNGRYLPTDEETDRTIEWISDTDNNALVKSVTINGVEDTSFAGQDYGKYVATSGDVDVHVVFETSSTVLPGNEDDEEEVEYSVTTSAKTGGDITDPYTYCFEEDFEQDVVYTADPGYFIESVKINGVEKSVSDNVGIGEAQGVYSFTEGDQKVEVTFTTKAMASSDAGTIILNPDKQELKKYDELNVEITLEPKNTSVDSTYTIDISDYELISCDKGEVKDTTISGTIKSGAEKEVINLKVKYSDGTLDGIVKVVLNNDGKKVEDETDIFIISVEDPGVTNEEDMSKYQNHSKNNDSEVVEDEDVVEENDSEKTNTSGNVKTGDETNNTVFCVLGLVAILGLVAAFVIKRRANKKIE